MENGLLEKEKNVWLQILIWITLIGISGILFSIITVGNLFHENAAVTGVNLYSGIYVLLLSLLVLGLVALLKRTKIIESSILSVILSLIIIVVIVSTIFVIRIAPVFDGAIVTNQAYELFNKLQWADYFYQFPNNVNIVTITYLLAKPWMGLNLIHSLEGFQLFCNIVGNILLGLTIVIFAYLVKKMRGKAGLNIFLLLVLLLSPMLSIFFSELYTQQIAILTMAVSFLTLYNLVQGKIKYLNGVLFLFFAAVTILSRPNMFLPYLIIAGLALFVYRIKFLKLILWCAMAFVMISGLKYTMARYTKSIGYQSGSSLIEQYQIPISSWFLTAYNYQDAGRNTVETRAITFHEPTKQTKDVYIKKHLTETIKHEGILNTLKLYVKKAAVLFGWRSDYSMGYFSARIGRESFRWYNDYVRGITWLSSSTLFAILLVNLGYVFSLIKTKMLINIPWLLVNLTAIAITLFYVLLWETQESYALPSIMLFLVGSAFIPFPKKVQIKI